MENDDIPIGKVLSRREALALLSATGAAFIIACAPGQTPRTQPTSAPATSGAPAAATVQASPTVAQATATTASAALPTCIVRPALTEGPYFVDEKLNRADIRSDPSDGAVSAGSPLTLVFQVSQIGAMRVCL